VSQSFFVFCFLLVVSQSICGVVSQSPFSLFVFLSLCRNHYMALCRNRRTRANGVAHRPRYFSAARPWILLYRGAACALIRSGARKRRAIISFAMSVVRTTWGLRSCARRDELITRHGAVWASARWRAPVLQPESLGFNPQ
jgi:hypothetical protein